MTKTENYNIFFLHSRGAGSLGVNDFFCVCTGRVPESVRVERQNLDKP